MNPFATFACRAYQTAFRIVIPLLPYREPKLLESVEQIPALLTQNSKRKPLIITDANLHNLGLLDPLKHALEQVELPFAIFDETTANPTIANVEAARELYLREQCDSLIAFGGGSPMDCAKVTGARIVKPNQPVSRMRGLLHVHKRLPLFIAVPTTAGTGSETTLAAVITDQNTHHKYPINDFSLIPHYAVLDAHTTVGLPRHVTATTGLDALVHATEAYIGRSTTAQTRAQSEEAVRLIDRYLKRAYDNGADLEAREGMLRAAYLAGAAFTKSYVGYIHGVAHSLGGAYGVPHGLANAVLAPVVLDIYGTSCHKRLAALARAAHIADPNATDAQAAARFIRWFRDLNIYMEIPEEIKEIDVADIPRMARFAAAESNPLYPVPRLMTARELEQIYHAVAPKAAPATAAQTAEPIEDIMARQRAFFATGKTIDVEFRLRALRRLQTAIRTHEAEIELALRADLGKSFFESYMCEVGLTLSELGYQLSHTRRWARPQRVRSDLANFCSTYRRVPEPYGVTLVMSPWNYPFMLTLEPLIGAIAAGNCCVVKPSAYSPATSSIIARLCAEVFEPGHVDVVLGGRTENTALLEQRFDYIFFTGSMEVGKLVQQKASRYLTPTTLELGGKSPCIIAKDADIKVAAARVAFGKWLNVGQTCVAPDYVLVDEAVEAAFVEELAAQARKMYGESALENPDYGHMINRKHFDRVRGLIDPNKVVYGGNANEDTLQIEPTIMTGCTGAAAAMQEEIFGPVLPIITVKNMDEAEAFVREREKPLALYLFTRNKRTEQRFMRYVPFGGGCVNDTIVHLATSHMPFGGVGSSGMGGYHGRASFETFSHFKSVLKKTAWPDLPLRYQPYAALKLALIRKFLH